MLRSQLNGRIFVLRQRCGSTIAVLRARLVQDGTWTLSTRLAPSAVRRFSGVVCQTYVAGMCTGAVVPWRLAIQFSTIRSRPAASLPDVDAFTGCCHLGIAPVCPGGSGIRLFRSSFSIVARQIRLGGRGIRGAFLFVIGGAAFCRTSLLRRCVVLGSCLLRLAIRCLI